MNDSPAGDYVLGTHDAEIARLALQHTVRSRRAALYLQFHLPLVSGFLTRTVPYLCPSDRSSEYRISAPAIWAA